MAINTAISVQNMTGGWDLVSVGPFQALEAGIIAATRIPVGQGDAGDIPMPMPGYIVGYMIASEAGSNFTVQATVDGTKDTGVTITVNAALEQAMFNTADYIEFTAGQVIGMEVVADTTSKDFSGWWLVALATNGY
jgi:hypothetical protein